METADSQAIATAPNSRRPVDNIRELFGSYKAEWLENRVYDLFTEPDYLPDLESPRPCFLIGGRGTGKTTVLRLMSYEGSLRRFGSDPEKWPYIGVYHRINSNRVTSFAGRELDEDDWLRVFGHYFNLLITDLLLDFCDWCGQRINAPLSLSSTQLSTLCLSLGLPRLDSMQELAATIKETILSFEFKINNIADGLPADLSPQGVPIEQLTRFMTQGGVWADKPIFILLDEYETLLRYQQVAINTLVKHSGSAFTFKIGVRDFGWKTHETLAEGQQLSQPADYALINITDRLLQSGTFRDFAEKVCNGRLSTVTGEMGRRITDVTSCFTGLPAEQEAHLLGVRPVAKRVWDDLESELDTETLARARSEFSDLELYLADLWAHQYATTAGAIVRDALADLTSWKTRYSNYRQAILYTIKRGKAGIRKYYCGWDALTQLASGNIRYLMQLVETCFVLSIEAGHPFAAPFSPDVQTRAAQIVGQNNLGELQAVSVEGARLTRLVLGLGRIFGVMAADPIGHTPDVTQFKVNFTERGDQLVEDPYDGACRELLEEGLTHLALVSQPGTKLTDEGEIRDLEYRVHPIYSAFFVFPAGRKRRIIFDPHQIVDLARSPRTTIRAVLEQQKRTSDESLPEHMILYADFYRDLD